MAETGIFHAFSLAYNRWLSINLSVAYWTPLGAFSKVERLKPEFMYPQSDRFLQEIRLLGFIYCSSNLQSACSAACQSN